MKILICYTFRNALMATLVFLSTTVQAEQKTFLGGRASRGSGNSESATWTLADWLSQKKEFAAMDQWLALNKTITNFEINAGGGHQTYDFTASGVVKKKDMEHYGLSLYWSIFGIDYLFEKSNENFKRESAKFNLRVFGTSSQSTNLTGFYGVRKWSFSNPSNEVQNDFAGGDLTLYLVSFFGLDGQYQANFKADDKNGTEYSGDRLEYGAFIDIILVRLYGKAFKETTNKKDTSNVKTQDVREGTEAGIKFYF